jgi:peptidoglycan/xylan/chitin deacetylase (PgdA/CDA1 family)
LIRACKPEEVIKSVMNQLEKHGKGIILMHDFKHHTAEALPELFRKLQADGYKVVHMVRERRGRHRAEIRRNACARGQAVLQQYAA